MAAINKIGYFNGQTWDEYEIAADAAISEDFINKTVLAGETETSKLSTSGLSTSYFTIGKYSNQGNQLIVSSDIGFNNAGGFIHLGKVTGEAGSIERNWKTTTLHNADDTFRITTQTENGPGILRIPYGTNGTIALLSDVSAVSDSLSNYLKKNNDTAKNLKIQSDTSTDLTLCFSANESNLTHMFARKLDNKSITDARMEIYTPGEGQLNPYGTNDPYNRFTIRVYNTNGDAYTQYGLYCNPNLAAGTHQVRQIATTADVQEATNTSTKSISVGTPTLSSTTNLTTIGSFTIPAGISTCRFIIHWGDTNPNRNLSLRRALVTSTETSGSPDANAEIKFTVPAGDGTNDSTETFSQLIFTKKVNSETTYYIRACQTSGYNCRVAVSMDSITIKGS